MEIDEVLRVLRDSKFFRNLAEKNLHRVASLCQAESHDAGDWVFEQGAVGEHLYIIVKGYIHLERAMTVGDREGHVIIDALGKGRTLGCWSALLGEPHVLMSTAVCQKPSLLLKIKGDDLRQMMMDSIDFGFDLMQRLCFLLRDRIEAAYGAMDRF
ncbi:MAG: cyclic nucleotide-binding domain-containing protein [Desulfosarcinaceae bacterium]|jgi:CRP-like cAMP-binding protein